MEPAGTVLPCQPKGGSSRVRDYEKTLTVFTRFTFVALLGIGLAFKASAAEVPKWVDLFNGKDLTGWIDVNTSPDTWYVKDGILVCKGKPIGVMRSEKQYENFLLHAEWRHMEPGGNSGIFAWSDAKPFGNRLPKGLEIQMLELDWVKLHAKKGKKPPPIAYAHGELFGAGGLKATPDNPRGSRSKSLENRCKGRGSGTPTTWSAWTEWSSFRLTESS